ncbi:MAG: hypothetical protein ACK5M7_13205 [Draconibacterium sp.]
MVNLIPKAGIYNFFIRTREPSRMLPIYANTQMDDSLPRVCNHAPETLTGNISETRGDGQNLGYGSFEARKANNRV